MGLGIVTVANAGGSNKQLKGIILFEVQSTTPKLFLQLPHPFLPVAAEGVVQPHKLSSTTRYRTSCYHKLFLSKLPANPAEILSLVPAEAKFLLVAPQYRGPGLHHRLREHVVQNYNLQRRRAFQLMPIGLDRSSQLTWSLALSPTTTTILLYFRATPFSTRMRIRLSTFFRGIIIFVRAEQHLSRPRGYSRIIFCEPP